MRFPNAMHLLHATWQFIACDVGARFIASAGVGWGIAWLAPFCQLGCPDKNFPQSHSLRPFARIPPRGLR
jgi:hypothetical protein